MLRMPRSLKVHATVEPIGDAIRFSGEGKPRICSTVNGRDAVCWAMKNAAKANVRNFMPCLSAADAAAPRRGERILAGGLLASLANQRLISVHPFWVLFQRHFLHAPVGDFADVQFVLASAIHLVDCAEFLQTLPCGPH